jgi:hypothetical protein
MPDQASMVPSWLAQRGRGGVDVLLVTAGDGYVRAVLGEVLGDRDDNAGWCR